MLVNWPCPCCGHQTLPRGPGDFELCPVCFWEDDGGQLRWPQNADGANGMSLMEAQRVYLRIGAVDQEFRDVVRGPRADEPLDPGWRPFDPEVDWANPELDGTRWPKNPEALYWWRTTYWNGDPDAMPAPPREPTEADALLDHLRRNVPEAAAAIAELEWQFGDADPFPVCARLGEVAIEAYRRGDGDVGHRIATAVAPGLDADSGMYAPNCVAVAFLENERWHLPAMRPFIDMWPDRLRAEFLEQHRFRTEALRKSQGWEDLWSTARGQPIPVVEGQLRDLGHYPDGDPDAELALAMTARVISDPHWVYKHPADALVLAWRHRKVQSPLRMLNWLRRPRFAG